MQPDLALKGDGLLVDRTGRGDIDQLVSTVLRGTYDQAHGGTGNLPFDMARYCLRLDVSNRSGRSSDSWSRR